MNDSPESLFMYLLAIQIVFTALAYIDYKPILPYAIVVLGLDMALVIYYVIAPNFNLI